MLKKKAIEKFIATYLPGGLRAGVSCCGSLVESNGRVENISGHRYHSSGKFTQVTRKATNGSVMDAKYHKVDKNLCFLL